MVPKGGGGGGLGGLSPPTPPAPRHHPFVGLLFLAANTLFLPIISPVANIMGEDDLFPPEVKNAARDDTSPGVNWDCAGQRYQHESRGRWNGQESQCGPLK